MREIKFRAWFKDTMILPYGSTTTDNYQFFGELNESAKLMQYTGLKDKNGVEIYEGDIFRDNEDRECDYVFFRMGGFATKTWWSPQELAEHAPQWKVIGNIYENKELLK